MHNLIWVCLIMIYMFNRIDLNKQSKFVILLNDTFNQNAINSNPIDQFSVTKDKLCSSRCSRYDSCESAVYDSLSRMCYLYSTSFDRFNFVRNGLVKLFAKKSNLKGSIKSGEVIQTYQLAYTVLYLQKLNDGTISCGCRDGAVRILDTNQNVIVKEYFGHGDEVQVIIEMSNGDLASGSIDMKVIIWDRNTATQKFEYTNHIAEIYGLAELSNGMIASGSWDNTIHVWNPTTGELILSNDVLYLVSDLKVLKNSRVAVTYLNYLKIEIWSSDMSSVLKTLTSSNGAILTISVLSNNLLASGSHKGVIELWNVTSYQKIANISAHTSRISGLKELDNGYLVSSSYDKTIQVWNINNRLLVSNISIHSYPIFGLEVTSNQLIISSGYDFGGTVDPPIKICNP